MNQAAKKQQHTAGPWVFAYGCVYAEQHPDCGVDDIGVRIALMDRNEPRTTPVERDNNTRLIAAAPDLLAALQEATHSLEWMVIHDGKIEHAPCLAAVKSAINKALKQ